MIKRLEELSMNAFNSQKVEFYDGWIIRLSGGNSKRINSVNTFYDSSINFDKKINYCESVFEIYNLKPTFKLTNISPLNLDDTLRKKNYKEAGRTSIQVLELKDINLERFEKDELKLELYESFNLVWFDEYCKSCGKSDSDKKAFYYTWNNIRKNHVFLSLKKNNRNIGYGVGIIEDSYIGIFGVFVEKEFRTNGYGLRITSELLKYGVKNNCKIAYLQVEINNTNAISVYKKIGFLEVYQYWYLLKSFN